MRTVGMGAGKTLGELESLRARIRELENENAELKARCCTGATEVKAARGRRAKEIPEPDIDETASASGD